MLHRRQFLSGDRYLVVRQHGDIVGIERSRAFGVGAERGDAAGDPAHRPHQQEQHRKIDQPAGHAGDQQREDGKILGELLQRVGEAAFIQPNLDRGVGPERAVVRHLDQAVLLEHDGAERAADTDQQILLPKVDRGVRSAE